MGKPQVTQVIPYEIPDKELLTIAASLENVSEHPLAGAIVEKCRNEHVEFKLQILKLYLEWAFQAL